tara:strand:- start:437 stop:904 length:468 start_codon:yes stop_codon:yes gene_type:complete
MTWFSILKETRQIASTGIRTKLGTTPLTMGDRDDNECCLGAFEEFIYFMRHTSRGAFWANEEWDEEGVKYTSHDLMTYAKQVIEYATQKPGFLDEHSDTFCDELGELMHDAREYYWNIVNDGSEKGNWSDAVRQAWLISDEIMKIFTQWDECEDE